MSRQRPRVAVCHPRLGRGGSEARALWLMQALRETCDVTLVTAGAVDLSRLNAFYGTDLGAQDFQLLRPRLARSLSFTTRANALRGVLLERSLRRVAHRFDACVSAYNPFAFGRAGVQFIADFSWIPALRDALHGHAAAPGLYKRLVARIRGTEHASAPRPEDLLIANSHFAADLLREQLGLACDHVLPPPVAGPLGGLPWPQREPGFLSLGRLSPEKRLEDQIGILQRVRARGHAVRLTVLGGPTEGAYYAQLRELVAEDPDWITWRGWVGGEEKWRLLGSHRFAIHTCRGEAFGISVAEMARAGCLPFVPSSGGPAEIVGEPRLLFDDLEEAVGKIVAVLEDPPGQEALSRALVERGAEYGAEQFMGSARALLEGWLRRSPVGA